MKIKKTTKFNIGDTVYYKENGIVFKGEVTKIIITTCPSYLKKEKYVSLIQYEIWFITTNEHNLIKTVYEMYVGKTLEDMEGIR